MDPASERYRAIVGQDISIQGIESGIVDIGTQHALFQVIEIMCRFPLCALQPRNVVVGGGRTFWGPHNDHSELSHFINSSSFCHPAVVRGVSKRPMGGKQAATAACFVRKVISA